MLWGIFDSNIRDELTYQAPNHAVFDYTDPAEIEKLEHSLAAANKTKGNVAQIKDKAGAEHQHRTDARADTRQPSCRKGDFVK